MWITSLTDFLGTSITLWLGAYLLTRAYASRVAQRAVVVLLALSLSFCISFLNLYLPIPNVGAWWALLLTIGLVAWYDLTYQLLPPATQTRTRWVAALVFVLGVVKMAFLVAFRTGYPSETASSLWNVPADTGLLAAADTAFLAATAGAILYNFRLSALAGIGPHSRATWLASFLGAASTAYGLLALVTAVRQPRFPQDALLVASMGALGYAVARHQALVERRTPLHDLPIVGLTVLSLSSVYVLIAVGQGIPAVGVAVIAWVAVITHSIYDLVHTALDRSLDREESELRRQLRRLAHDSGTAQPLETQLQPGLNSLCHTLNASAGLIAVLENGQFVVKASLHSFALGTPLAVADVARPDLAPADGALAENLAWLAPAYAAGEQSAVIGIGPRRNRSAYSQVDLDLLADMADWAGRLAAEAAEQTRRREQLQVWAAEIHARDLNLEASADEIIDSYQEQPDPAFVHQVEEALRSLSDFTELGRSPLVEALKLARATHIESGKAVRERLMATLETLRPAGPRPAGVLPREWHSYAVLHDAYVEDVTNREIMARLYISQGTVNRLRRKALNGAARALLELHRGDAAHPPI